ncbi:sulfatase [Prosthecobacter sp.]|uniref:sulfatase n=1 Tax=Prosthecobacter sp. TaxID=1965333 RepID=UPI0037833FEC
MFPSRHLLLALALALQAAAAPPNVILINCDDLGYGDLGCYGSKVIATPQIDRMAREGVRFTNFHVASSFCSPSRAALLTGRLPARCGVPYVLFPSEHTGLPPEEITIAEVLKQAGYATACVGKWHLGWRREFRPQQQGFDEFFGLLHTNDTEEWRTGLSFHQLSMFEPSQLRDGDHVIEAPVDLAMLTQQYTRRALDFIRRQHERPFFLYLAHTMPHIPQYASPAFAGKSKNGVYGDCVEEIDWSTGSILDLLRELHLDERTLVIFTSDNGSGVHGAKARTVDRFPGHSFAGSNGALRGGKGSTFEGGLRVPCIVWWPKTIAAGRDDDTPWSALDFLPTCAQLAHTSCPAGVTLDGMDSSRLLLGQPPPAEPRTLFHYFGVQLQAVTEGPWKLFVPVASPPEMRVPSLWFEHQPGLFERQHRLWPSATLYHLSEDIGEAKDRSSGHPEIVASMLEKARAFDAAFQKQLQPVQYLPGPKPPAPGQIRSAADDIDAWLKLTR